MKEWILSASVLILVVVGLRAVLRGKIAPWLQYGLWLLVLVRLLVPGSFFTSPISVERILPETMSAETLDYDNYITLTQLSEAPDGFDQVESSTMDDRAVESGTMDDRAVESGTTDDRAVESSVVEAPQPVKRTVDAEMIFLWVWLIGMGITAAVLLGCDLRFYGRLRRSRQALDTASKLPVYLAEGLPSPCLFGLLRPAIYVPLVYGAPQMTHVLIHEERHYYHGDHLWSLLRSLALVLHWYNPLVWLAVALSRQDGEMACDAAAIRQLGEAERFSYGQTLLSLVTAKPRTTSLLSCATTMDAGKHSLKQRIACIAKKPKMLAVTVICVLLVVLTAVGCTFAGAPVKNPEPVQLTHYATEFSVELSGTDLEALWTLYDSHHAIPTSQPMDIHERIIVTFADGKTWTVTPTGICSYGDKTGNYLVEDTDLTAVCDLFWKQIQPTAAGIYNPLLSILQPALPAEEASTLIDIYRNLKLTPTEERSETATTFWVGIEVDGQWKNLFYADAYGLITLPAPDDHFGYYTSETGKTVYRQLREIKEAHNTLSTEKQLADQFLQQQIINGYNAGQHILDWKIELLECMTDPNSDYQAWRVEYEMLTQSGTISGETDLGYPVVLYYQHHHNTTDLGVTWTKVVEEELGGDYELAVRRAKVNHDFENLFQYDPDSQVLQLSVAINGWKFELAGRYEVDGEGYSYHASMTPGEAIEIDLAQFTELWLTPVQFQEKGNAIDFLKLVEK